MRLWSKAVDEGLFEGVMDISFSAMFCDRVKNMTDAQREQRFANVGDPRRRDRVKSTFEHGIDSPFVFNGIAAYEKAFKNMAKELDGGGPWLLGDQFSLADINMMPFVNRLEYLGFLDIWIDNRAQVQEWWERAKQRLSQGCAGCWAWVTKWQVPPLPLSTFIRQEKAKRSSISTFTDLKMWKMLSG
jgi:hypothetical protein